MKVLNLYACLGGNRLKWDEVADIEVTAVELDPELAKLYQERFPNDRVVVADAHAYLLGYFREYDFIWSSPPCPTHSKVRFTQKNTKSFQDVYPDMSLYQEILLLQNFFGGKWVVENVTPYYQPLIPAQKRGRHLYWANFTLPSKLSDRLGVNIGRTKNEVEELCKFHDYDFRKYKGEQRLGKIARNLVDYEAGRTIFETACNAINAKSFQNLLF